MSSLAKYKVAAPSAFARYYDAFLQNSFAGARWRITALSGETLVGVPMAGSMVDPEDPDVSFIIRSDDGATYRIPFRELAEAEPLGKDGGGSLSGDIFRGRHP